MAIVPDQSRSFAGTQGLGAQALYLQLYINDVTPAATHVATHFVPSITSVTPHSATLAAGSWGGANSNGTMFATILSSSGTMTFTYSASIGTVYGYTITTGTLSGTLAAGTLVAVERFGTPQVITANGDKISIVPKLAVA